MINIEKEFRTEISCCGAIYIYLKYSNSWGSFVIIEQLVQSTSG